MKKIHYNYLMAISLLGLIVCFAFGIVVMKRQAITSQKNAIGALFLQNEEMSEEYLLMLFKKNSEQNIEAAEAAFEEFGYTEKGELFLADKLIFLQTGKLLLQWQGFLLSLFFT